MEPHDDDLSRFAAEGAQLPPSAEQGYVENDGARIWYARYGAGAPVILLHGGLGHSGNWAYQVPDLLHGGYGVVVVDSRGHGGSTRDAQPDTYELMASDVRAVMDHLQIDRAALVGWSDGACTALTLADQTPERVAGVFYFGCNMDASGTKEFVFTPILGHCISRHRADYARLSATPDDFDAFSDAVGLMQRTQPNYSAGDLARIRVPVAIVHREHDEFIKREHAEYLARSLPTFGKKVGGGSLRPGARSIAVRLSPVCCPLALGCQSDAAKLGAACRQCHEIPYIEREDDPPLSRGAQELGLVVRLRRDPIIGRARHIMATLDRRAWQLPD